MGRRTGLVRRPVAGFAELVRCRKGGGSIRQR